ncbi:MAG: FAD-binding protein [Oscillospiraceae bacterium]
MKKMSTWRTPPAPIPPEQIETIERADVVIVGLGFAGTAALRAVAEKGGSVIGIEEMPEKSYNAWGRHIGHINSKFLESRGVPKVDIIEYFNEWMRRAGNRANPGLIMKFIKNCGDAFDWYTDMIEDKSYINVAFWLGGKKIDGELSGYKFWPGTAEFETGPAPMFRKNAPPSVILGQDRFPESEGKNMRLTQINRANHRKAEALGARTRFGIEAMQLVKEGNRVSGVVGRDREGKYHLFLADKGVILAAGDFGGNREMVMDLVHDIADLYGDEKFFTMGRKGRGIQMGVWAGGRLEAGTIPVMGGNFFVHRGLSVTFGVLWLDPDGKRYCNEMFGDPVMTGMPGNQMKRGTYYNIFDHRLYEDVQWAVPAHEGFDETQYYDAQGYFRECMEAALKAGKGGTEVWGMFGPIRIAGGNSMEELLDNAELEGQVRTNVQKSIERYNEICRLGRDEDFGKDSKLLRELEWPMFIQFCKAQSVMLCTVGGLLTDENQNVLDKNFEPIPGLFATGNCCGRRFGTQYSTPTSGVSIGIAITLGREAGYAALGEN